MTIKEAGYRMTSFSHIHTETPQACEAKRDDMRRLHIKILRHVFRFIAPYAFGPKHQDIWPIGRFLAKVIGKSTIDTCSNDGSWICFPLPIYTMYFLYGPDIKKYNVDNLTPIFRKNIIPGTVVIDVGASCGQEIVELSKAVGNSGTVYAFEPSKSFNALIRTVSLNDLTNVVCVKAGCGNENGYFKEADQKEYYVGANTLYGSSGTPIVRIDDFLKFIGEERPVSLIKIDTDGFELEVTQGATETIKNGNSCVVAEFEKQFSYSGLNGKDVLKEYNALGYDISKIQTSEIKISEEEFDNYLSDINSKHNMIAHDLVLRRKT
tara:strand:- start:172 stop:1137 length:966 start_codon:yes stop_codon:yes gene_type:complete